MAVIIENGSETHFTAKATPMARPLSQINTELLIVAGSVVSLVVLISAIVLVVSSITAPTRYDLFDRSIGGISCASEPAHHGVIVVIPLRLLSYGLDDKFWRVDRLEASGAKNTEIAGSDRWRTGVGFSADETPPTHQMVERVWNREDQQDPSANFRASRTLNLAVAISPVTQGKPMTLSAIRVISTGGEPEYFQDFRVGLNADSGKCSVSSAAIG